jgi:hypothetical protein
METNGRPFDVVKKIGTGTSHRDIFPEFSRDRLGARPIFSQPLWASGCLGNRKPGPMAKAMSMAGPLARNRMSRLGENAPQRCLSGLNGKTQNDSRFNQDLQKRLSNKS